MTIDAIQMQKLHHNGRYLPSRQGVIRYPFDNTGTLMNIFVRILARFPPVYA
ncbi:hypothetical protein [[Erwinia] mediterraneensis]|uniref:hypothetical protein n=1 Tax=[Erwinia] mediterraneensis TaxID=2161819 RepID=UPI0013EF052F|nr:hypothetical protein [[Erwinia] mediterraneensis]